MNDSAKLRFVYGIFFLVIAFVIFGGIISLIFLMCFDILSPDLWHLCIILFILFILTISTSINYFIEQGRYMPQSKED